MIPDSEREIKFGPFEFHYFPFHTLLCFALDDEVNLGVVILKNQDLINLKNFLETCIESKKLKK